MTEYDPESPGCFQEKRGKEYDPEEYDPTRTSSACNECVLLKISLRHKEETISNLHREVESARRESWNKYHEGKNHYDRLAADYQNLNAYVQNLKRENEHLRQEQGRRCAELERMHAENVSLHDTLERARAYASQKPRKR